MTPSIFQWVADWREDRLGIGQWMAAAIALAGAAVVYCLLSGWAAGELSRPSLSLVWAIVVGVVATATCALLRYWWHRASCTGWIRGAGCVAILVGGVAMLVCGEKVLAMIFWGRPWDGFLAHFAVRSPLAALMLAVVALPRCLQFRPRARSGEFPGALERPAPTGVFLKVPTAIGERNLAAERVLRIQAAGNYVELYTEREAHLLRGTLSSLAARLENSGFVQVHRSILVNRRHVNRIERDSNGEWRLRMADDTMVRVGRHYRAAAEAIIHQRRQTSSA